MKKHIGLWLTVTMLLSFSLCFYACGSESRHIEDSNGESKELAVITDADIQSGSYRCIQRDTSSSSKGRGASGAYGIYRDKDNDYSRIAAKRFSGIQIANVCKGTGADVIYTVESTVSQGNFKIVITDEDYQILQAVPLDEKATVTVPTEKGKLYFVTYAGESAEIKVELWRTIK